MWYWWIMLACDLIIPITMIISGIIMQKHCPKHINGLLGYRTTRSMKNMDTWKFAHDFCGRLWWKIGAVMLLLSVAVHIPFYHSDETTLGIVELVVMTIQCIALIVPIFLTEKALKNTFNPDGTER